MLHMVGVIVQNKEHHEMHGDQIDHNETAVQRLKEERDEALVELFAMCADSKRVFNKNYATALSSLKCSQLSNILQYDAITS